LKLADFPGRKIGLLDEMQEHRPEGTAEDSMKERTTFRSNALLSRSERQIEIGPPVPFDADHALFHKTSKESLYGLGMPILLIGEIGDNLGSGKGRLSPENA
jgi:hypothetical protein